MQQAPIQVTTELSAQDVQEFNLWYSFITRFVVIIFNSASLLAIMLLLTKETDPLRIAMYAAAAIGLGALMFNMRKSSMARRSRQTYESDEQSKLPQHYTISEEGISHESETGSGHVTWKDLHKIGESRNLYVLFVGNSRAMIVPKRFFASESDQEAFKELARKHLFSSQVKFKSKMYKL